MNKDYDDSLNNNKIVGECTNNSDEDNYDTETSNHITRQLSSAPAKSLHELLGDTQSLAISKHAKQMVKKVSQKSDINIRLRFTELVGAISDPQLHLRRPRTKRLNKSMNTWTFSIPQESLFKKISSKTIIISYNSISTSCFQKLSSKPSQSKQLSKPKSLFSFCPLTYIPWEDKVIWNDNISTPIVNIPLPFGQKYSTQLAATRIQNDQVSEDHWTDSVVWDDSNQSQINQALSFLNKPTLNEMDPYLIIEREKVETVAEKLLRAEQIIIKKLKQVKKTKEETVIPFHKPEFFLQPIPDSLNISNDEYYIKKTGKQDAFTILGQGPAEVQHSIPALKLQSPYYKKYLTKSDLRRFHRPQLYFSFNTIIKPTILFKIDSKDDQSTVINKDRKDDSMIRSVKHLTLADIDPYLCIEYSEQLPILTSKQGMGSLLQHYYRKRTTRDFFNPDIQDPMICPIILDPAEPSPFLGFGNIKQGDQLSAISNNLFRAPVFAHSPNQCDFLLIRQFRKGTFNYYIRSLPESIWIAGQTLPLMEVYAPQSRRATLYCKNRVEVAVYREYQRKAAKRMHISKIVHLFPQFQEVLLRKWLRDISDPVRLGRDGGWWEPKKQAPNLSEEELESMITPEMVCLYESMMAGKQQLMDAGYYNDFEEEQEDEFVLDEEIKLAPWNLSHNFIFATQGKLLVELIGSGDPTGCEEGFSFVRIPLKNTFSSKWIQDTIGNTTGKISISQQQQAYKDQIMKIWDAQNTTLSRTESGDEKLKWNGEKETMHKRTCTKVLVIKREVIQDGRTIIEQQIVDDPRVISEYLAQKKLEQMKSKILSKHKKIIEGPKTKKHKKEEESIAHLNIDMKAIICTECGQHGHVRNTRQCSLYEREDDYQTESAKITIPKSVISSPIKEVLPSIKLKLKSQEMNKDKLLKRLSKEFNKILNNLVKIPNVSIY